MAGMGEDYELKSYPFRASLCGVCAELGHNSLDRRCAFQVQMRYRIEYH